MFCKRIAALIHRHLFTPFGSKSSNRSRSLSTARLQKITRHLNNHTKKSGFYPAQFLSTKASTPFLSTTGSNKDYILAAEERFKNSQAYLESRLVEMKLDTPSFQEIFTPELHRLIELFKTYGHELRIAGGAVRDLVLGKIPHDIDFATTATPDEMKAMFEKEGVRLINAKGESHGTITCRINDKVC